MSISILLCEDLLETRNWCTGWERPASGSRGWMQALSGKCLTKLQLAFDADRNIYLMANLKKTFWNGKILGSAGSVVLKHFGHLGAILPKRIWRNTLPLVRSLVGRCHISWPSSALFALVAWFSNMFAFRWERWFLSIILDTSLGRLDLVYVNIQKAIHFGLNHFYLWAESCDVSWCTLVLCRLLLAPCYGGCNPFACEPVKLADRCLGQRQWNMWHYLHKMYIYILILCMYSYIISFIRAFIYAGVHHMGSSHRWLRWWGGSTHG